MDRVSLGVEVGYLGNDQPVQAWTTDNIGQYDVNSSAGQNRLFVLFCRGIAARYNAQYFKRYTGYVTERARDDV